MGIRVGIRTMARPSFVAPVLGCPDLSDDFDDNDLNTVCWEEYKTGVTTVTEQNERLEVDGAVTGEVGGISSMAAYDIDGLSLKVDVLNDARANQLMYVVPTKTPGGAPGSEDDYYNIRKNNQANAIMVARKLGGGSPTVQYIASWSGAGGSLRIVLYGGLIFFFEEDEMIYSEAYALPSSECYIWLLSTTLPGLTGMDYFDNVVVRTATVTILAPVDDCFANKQYPDNVNNGTTFFSMNYTSNRHRVPYLKFDVAALAGKTIESAMLYLYQDDRLPSGWGRGSVMAYEVDDDTWLEESLTWNTRPALGALLDTVSCVQSDTWYGWNVKSWVAEVVAAEDDYVSLALDRAYGNGLSRFKSKEYDTLDPYLVIEYTE